MHEIWVADSETEPFKYRRIPRPFIWGAYNGSEYHEFKTTEDFVAFIAERDCIVYAHNGGKFDWMFLIEHLEPFAPLMLIGSRLAKFRIGKAEFRDSYNILPVPLAAYQKEKIDYAIFEPEEREKPQNMVKIREYLRSDCVYLYQLIAEFQNKYGSGLTLAGSAMKVWQKMSGEKAPATSSAFYESLSPYYYGGRVECFQSGIIERSFNVIDINSAYPFAMLNKHPYGDTYVVMKSLPDCREKTQRSFITLRAKSRGALPFRADDGSLIFPNDDIERVYHVTGWEFIAAIETRAISDWEIIKVVLLPLSVSFTDYVEHFYSMKSEAKKNSPEYIFAKLFLNSLYGKFGANPDKYEEFTVVRPQYVTAAECDGYAFSADLGKYCLVSRPLAEHKQRYYNVAVAASITGFVRAYLWRAINQCKGVIYCDTDSIACESTGSLELDASKLGAWDKEAECDFGAVAGKKLYAFRKTDGEWKTATKGVKLSAAEIIEIAKGGEATYMPEAPTFSIKRRIKIFGEESTFPENLDRMFQTRTVRMQKK